MSDGRQPEPGEWWIRTKPYRGIANVLVYMIGKDPEGCMIGMRRRIEGADVADDGSSFVFAKCDQCEFMEYAPNCTGWDWRPPSLTEQMNVQQMCEMIVNLRDQVAGLTKNVNEMKARKQ